MIKKIIIVISFFSDLCVPLSNSHMFHHIPLPFSWLHLYIMPLLQGLWGPYCACCVMLIYLLHSLFAQKWKNSAVFQYISVLWMKFCNTSVGALLLMLQDWDSDGHNSHGSRHSQGLSLRNSVKSIISAMMLHQRHSTFWSLSTDCGALLMVTQKA